MSLGLRLPLCRNVGCGEDMESLPVFEAEISLDWKEERLGESNQYVICGLTIGDNYSSFRSESEVRWVYIKVHRPFPMDR